MSTNKQNNNSGGAGMFLIISLFFLGISVYQTGLGFEQMFGNLSWIMSFGIGILMLFLAFEMRKRKKRGESAIMPLVGYFVLAIFSFIGNFNALYTRFNKAELYKTELQQHKTELTGVVTASKDALNNLDPASIKLKSDIEELKGQLKMQILDPANPGIGKRARKLIGDIETLLGTRLTTFSGTPDQLATSYSRNIDEILKTRMNKGKLSGAKELILEIEQLQASVEPTIIEALKPGSILEKGQEANFKVVDIINEIGTKTKEFLGNQSSYNYDMSEFQNQEVGKLSHSFASAFNGKNTAAAMIILIAAIFIDAVVPFIVFVSTRKEDDEEEEENKEEENTTGARVTVIN